MGIEGLRGLLGIAVLITLAWAVSERRAAFPVRTVTIGVACQLVLAGEDEGGVSVHGRDIMW